MKFRIIFALFAVMAWLNAGSAAADDENPFSVALSSKQIFESDVNIQSGEISISDTRFSFMHEFKLDNDLPIEWGINYKHLEIDENTATEIPSHLEGVQGKVGTKFPMPFVDSREMFMGVDVMPSMYTDDGSWTTSAFRMPFRVYGIYKESDELIFVAGVSIRPDFDQSVLPVIGLIYKPNDELAFNLASDNPTITYKVDDAKTVFLELDFTNDEYEVTQNGAKGRILKNRDFSTGAGLNYQITDLLKASVSGGVVFARRLQYEDPIGKLEPDAAGYVKAKVELSF